MAAKHKARTAAYPEPWREHATIVDAYYFARREFDSQLHAYRAAMLTIDDVHAIEALKRLRGVVDKLDAFRRMKVREWTAAEAAKPNTQEVKP